MLALAVTGLSCLACRNSKEGHEPPLRGEGLRLPEKEVQDSPFRGDVLPLPELDPPALLGDLRVSQTPGDKVVLRYSPGKPFSYDVTLSQSSTQKRGGQEVSLGSTQMMVIEWEPLEQGKDEWKVNLKLSNIRIEAGEGGSKPGLQQSRLEQLAKAMELARFSFKTNAQGEVLDFEMPGGESGVWSEMRDVVEMLVKDSLTVLPVHKVAPGDSWDTTREGTLRRSKTESKVRSMLKSTFLGFTTLPGLCIRCAVIRTLGDSMITGRVTVPGMGGKTLGRGKTDSVAVLDMERGRLVSSQSAAVTIETFKLESRSSCLSFIEETTSSFSQSLKQGTKDE